MSMSYVCNLVTESQYTPVLNISEQYAAENVTVTVEWSQQVGATYSVRVLPLVPIMFNEYTSYQLTVSYNMKHNLSVVANAPCRIGTSAFITLNYGELIT